MFALLHSIFRPSKGQATRRTFGFGVLAIVAIVANITATDTYYANPCLPWFFIFLLIGGAYGLAWYAKYDDDKQLAERAINERTDQLEPDYSEPIQKTPGSSYIGLDNPHAPPESL